MSWCKTFEVTRRLCMSRLLVLYHANCHDGFCAAWITRQVHPDAEFMPVQYGQSPPDVKDRNVLILDFSYPRVILEKMFVEASSLEVLDHHKTAEAELKGLDYCLFDMTKSGARLAWEWFHPYETSPWVVDYVEDRDLWNWKLPNSKAMNAAIRSYPMDFAVWDQLFKNEAEYYFNHLPIQGEGILRREVQIVADLVKGATEIVIGGHKVLVVNTSVLISETGHRLCYERPFGVTYFESGGHRFYSLRSSDAGEDVSLIAKQFGGGGHRNAAGFNVVVKELVL